MLDALHDVIARLQGRIAQHGELLSKSEAATRYTLIDPLLTALAWDLSDPTQVRVEYLTDRGRADYVLFAGRKKPQAVVEAKRLGADLDPAIRQSLSYCLVEGIKYSVVTDGERWRAYDSHRLVPLREKLRTSFSLTDTSRAVGEAAWLWRGNFESGGSPVPSAPRDDSETSALTDILRASEGTPLTELVTVSGQKPPSSIVFPDMTAKPIGKWWYGLPMVAVEWLVTTGNLRADDCPVIAHSARLVHIEPIRADGTKFPQPKQEQISKLWVAVEYNMVGNLRVARHILQARDVDPATVTVIP